MATRSSAQNAQKDSLSSERIVDAAVALLDESGESGLTFRALAAALKTGPGAIYWHVADKRQLLRLASNAVLAKTLTVRADSRSAAETIRYAMVEVFDTIDQHPWVGTLLSQNAWQSTAMLRIFELTGQQLQRGGVAREAQFHCATALLSFTLGAGGQNAVNARAHFGDVSREEILSDLVDEWEALDQEEYPFLHAVAPEMRDHDDREQFAAGIDMILAGVGLR